MKMTVGQLEFLYLSAGIHSQNLEPTKFVILIGIKFGDFCKIWILANLKSLTLKFQNLKSLTLKFQNLKSLTLTQKFPIWTQFF